ncbi:MAG TPA: L-seryl-tRNA(Sec) selenium transferase [Candidatus Limnocylindrales bacterium]|nr:L-seryl-tRNA(Sec) selenium transferase [Candidatus Limnocylindrales bacterium]
MSEAARLLPLLPSVDRVLSSPEAEELEAFSRGAVTSAVRGVLESLRERIRSGGSVGAGDISIAAVVDAASRSLRAANGARLRRVVNATGVVLHTNLGRAWLADAAMQAVVDAAGGACNLEYDLARGERGDRDDLVEEHLCELTGAEAATVVNNNAAAVMLVLNTLADGREVIVSRGELIEIGGAFRIPEIMSKSGAILREVGTTNRTHVSDYRSAVGPRTALFMKVHTSNYRIVGFSSSVAIEELAALKTELQQEDSAGVVSADPPDVAARQPLHVIEDLGAGALVDLTQWGLAPEPLVGERVRAGADIVTSSGDKLLGGPQCGIIVGRRELIERMRRNPLKRAFRCDKMTLAALEATLRVYRYDPAPQIEIPTLRYLLRPVEDLRIVGEQALALLAAQLGDEFALELVETRAQSGSGSQPEVAIASLAIAVRSAAHSPDAIARRFRAADPPIIGRIERDTFLLDLRLIDDPRDLVPHPGQA